MIRNDNYGRQDGSGKGVGQPGGMRRNKNTEPCENGKQNGTGRGYNRNFYKDDDNERKSPPKKYKETGATKKTDYADPEHYKYPIHTYENVRAAISYLAQPKNSDKYTTEEKKAVANKICTAAKKFKINVSDDWKKKMGLKVDVLKCGHKFKNGILIKE